MNNNRAASHLSATAFFAAFSTVVSIAGGALAFPVEPPALPPCTNIMQTLNLDLSTTSVANAADRHWTVSGPYGGANPHNQTPPTGWANLPNWIQPYAGPPPYAGAAPGYVGPDPNAPDGEWAYQIQFNILGKLSGYSGLALSGNYWADNDVVYFYLNKSANTGPLCIRGGNPPFCFLNSTSFSFAPAELTQGLNTLTIVVRNYGLSATGVAVQAKLSARCFGVVGPQSGGLHIQPSLEHGSSVRPR